MTDSDIPGPEDRLPESDAEPIEPELDPDDDYFDETSPLYADTEGEPEDEAPVPRPINWDLLTPDEAEHEWFVLNQWVHWLRKTYGLGAAVIPPFWHRHKELLWELSALHLHWLGAYDKEQDGSAPIGWHKDFAEARDRLREWVTTAGTRLDRDRATRQTAWPGEEADQPAAEHHIADREQDFLDFVEADIAHRRELEAELQRLREGSGHA